MSKKIGKALVVCAAVGAGYLLYTMGKNDEFNDMVERVKKSPLGKIYTFLPNGDYVEVAYCKEDHDI